MAKISKCCWLILLLIGIAASPKLNLPIQPAAVVQPPNTNTYGCKLIWDAVPFAEQYRVYLGDSPSSLLNITNVATTGAVFRVWATNVQPWVGVKAVVQGQESDMSELLTRTNYVRVFLASNGVEVIGQTIVNPSSNALFKAQIAKWSNWPQ